MIPLFMSSEEILINKYKQVLIDIANKGYISSLQYKYFVEFANNGICNLKWIIEQIDIIKNYKISELMSTTFGRLFKYNNNLTINKNIKYYLTRTDTINLTPEQKKAMQIMYNFLIDHTKNIIGVYGYAGTGKTTTIVEFVSYMIQNKYLKRVVFTAPTNKAVNVIKNKIKPYIKKFAKILFERDISDNFNFDDEIDFLEQNGIILNFITIHKLLMFKTDFSVDGDTIFVRNNKQSTMISKFELVVIDECSMISTPIIECIFDDLRKLSIGYNTPKLIFSGDPAQLPPVNEDDSTIFCKSRKELPYKKYKKNIEYKQSNTIISNMDDMMKQKYKLLITDLFKMKNILLQHVVRSRIDNVTQICYELREWVVNDKMPVLIKYRECIGVNYFDNIKGINKINSEWFVKFLNSIKNNISCIIITWTNQQTTVYNEYIRRQLFSGSAKKFEPRDILMLSEFYALDFGEDVVKQKLYTSEQIKVESAKLMDVPINCFQMLTNSGLKRMKQIIKIEGLIKNLIDDINETYCKNTVFTCWILQVNKCDDNIKNTIIVVDDVSSVKYKKFKSDISTIIKNFSKDMLHKYKTNTTQVEKFIINPLWRQWNKIFVEPFACVNYGYSITCHKGQGSSFYDVYVDLDDILQNKKITEAKKCAYTAATRAINELNILI